MSPMDLQRFGTWERQTSGQWHLPGTDPEVSAEHARTFKLVKQFNELGNVDHERAKEILREILPEESEVPGMHAPLNLEYGRNLVCGKGVFINFGATILAQAKVTLGERIMIGPNCSLITVGHPVNDHEMREGGWEIAKPITVGRNTWFGANVTVMPGVTIGENCVVGAGALVTRDIPDNSLVLGAPGRVVRKLEGENLERVDLEGPVEGFGAGELPS
ncbi:sugar O-acetyltransferase [Corynebacterium sp. SA-MJD20WY100]|uniref:sugar O-acetyltransferase n=1 Tax=Corynebacterium sp. SA-MJD20WY100 TaxID=3142969 RepID=UPI003221CA86